MSEYNDEDNISETFDIAASSIRHTIDYQRELAVMYRERAAECERYARRIEQATMAGHWWELGAVLEEHEIELLCNVEPSDRSDFLSNT